MSAPSGNRCESRPSMEIDCDLATAFVTHVK